MGDPLGLLEHVPELARPARHPVVKKALASGKPLKVYRALWMGSLLGWFPQDTQAVRAVLKRRRLFRAEVRAPAMFRVNGIGFALHGKEDLNPEDGSYIATHFFTFVFLPVLPVGQHLVIAAEDGGWHCFGKVPPSQWVRAWRGLASLAVLAVAGAIGWAVFQGGRVNDVVVENALEVPVVAHVGEVRIDVGPTARTKAEVATGMQPVRIESIDGRVLEEGELEVRRWADVIVWNVLGAAPLYLEHVWYTEHDAPVEERPAIPHCGDRAIVHSDADYMYRPAPAEINSSSSSSVIWQTHFDLEEGGWSICEDFLAGYERYDEAAALYTAQARVTEPDSVSRAVEAMRIYKNGPAALAWVEAELPRLESLELHRVRQTLAEAEGVDLSEEYAKRQTAAPEDPEAHYLAARALTDAEALPRVRSAALEFPDHVYLARSLAYLLHHEGHYEEALVAQDRLHELDGATDREWAIGRAHTLAAAGRVAGAVALLDAEQPQDLDEHLTWTWIKEQAGPVPVPALAEQEEYIDSFLLRAELGEREDLAALPEHLAELGPLLELIAAVHDGGDVTAAYEASPNGTEYMLHPQTMLLVMGEVVRGGDTELLARLENSGALGSNGRLAMRGLQPGADEDAIRQLPRIRMEAALFAYARQPHVTPERAAELRAEVAELDYVKGTLANALRTWTFREGVAAP